MVAETATLSTSVFGDKANFAIEAAFFPYPGEKEHCCWDEVGTYGYFNLFINGKSVFPRRMYDMVDDPTDRVKGYKILDTFTLYDEGRTDHLGPLFSWLEHVYDTVTAESKTRFKRCGVMESPYGTSGNIYPDIFVKRSGNEVIVWSAGERADFPFQRHCEFFVKERTKMNWPGFAVIVKEVLDYYYAQPSVKSADWFKEYNPRFIT
jgi:hypothetical protein